MYIFLFSCPSNHRYFIYQPLDLHFYCLPSHLQLFLHFFLTFNHQNNIICKKHRICCHICDNYHLFIHNYIEKLRTKQVVFYRRTLLPGYRDLLLCPYYCILQKITKIVINPQFVTDLSSSLWLSSLPQDRVLTIYGLVSSDLKLAIDQSS